MTNVINVHGTCVDIDGRGVLLRGGPGAGKSDLALRLIEGGARLVADDRVDLVPADGRVTAQAPARLDGLLEVRGVGIVRIAPERIVGETTLHLVVDLVGADAVERLPEPASDSIGGVTLPLLRLYPFEVSAPAKLRLAAGAGPGSIMAAP